MERQSQLSAYEARMKSDGFKDDYFENCYRRIDGAARRGKEYVVLQHAPDTETEQKLIKRLRAQGYKVYENALFVGWYNARPSSFPINKYPQRESICDAYTARCELNAHRQEYIAKNYHLIWEAAQEGNEWCQLTRSADKQLEKLLCKLLTEDGYEVHESQMIASWL